MTCPACASTRTRETVTSGVHHHQCRACGAIFGSCYLGDSYALVLPQWHTGASRHEDERAYDFECLGSKGITRRHGWFNIHSRAITQVG